MLTFAANLSTLFQEFPFFERFNEAKKCGFKFYELQFPYDYAPTDIGRYSTGLKPVLMNSYVDASHFGFATVPGQDYLFAQSINKISSYYLQLGMPKVHIIAGEKHPNFTADEQMTCYVNNLKSISEFLEDFNMIGVIEPMCEEVKPGYFLNSFDLAVEALNLVKSENIKLLIDVYHLHKITGDVKTIENYYPYAGHIQISQSPGRVEPFFPGGEIDYEYVFKFLESKNHVDPIGLEYSPSHGLSTEQSLEWMKKFSA